MDSIARFLPPPGHYRNQKGNTMPIILPLSDLQINPTAYRFEGGIYGDVAVSFFLVHTKPGQGASLHSHPYPEVFLVQEGKVTFVVGSEIVTVDEGQVVIVPALTPHKFTHVGTTPLRMCGIHPTKEIIQHQLEE
jgi:mannose-6-phosphate isomerase-like protein (cupin superfamily)